MVLSDGQKVSSVAPGYLFSLGSRSLQARDVMDPK
jgi:hypothetical protein